MALSRCARTAFFGDAGPRATPVAGRNARVFLVVVHLPMILFLTLMGATGLGLGPAGRPAIAVPAGLALGALQIRQSLAYANGVRPRLAIWSFIIMLVLVIGPMTVLHANPWLTSLWFIGASAAMLAPTRLRFVAIAVPGAAFLAVAIHDAMRFPIGLNAHLFNAVYSTTIYALGAGAICGAARLVQVADELYDARAALAEMAVGRERLRVSRDLHDLLGQSLSAVSLKGDLAIRLLASDPERAAEEIRSVTNLARDTLRDVRAVALDQRLVTLDGELAGARELLGAAGVDAHVRVNVGPLDRQRAEVMAWTVREGVTNVLRHSAADVCSIRAEQHPDGRLQLEITNNGAVGATGTGSGLRGLDMRASAVGGTISTTRDGDWFRLQLELPGAAPGIGASP
jgi:two-component system, NarL family, sensor histidine kinase DesK